MSRFFNGLFFKFYALAKRTGNKKESDAMFTAVCAVSILIYLNVLSLLVHIECQIWHTEKLFTEKLFQLSIGLIIGAIVYFLFMYRNRYTKLYLNYKEDRLYSQRQGTWLAIIYIILTFCLFASLIWIKCR
jgi:peptidoglycan biosynthesis protein MviN/MurJ (putative lipid II flippase)